jgi:hypothetical protein
MFVDKARSKKSMKMTVVNNRVLKRKELYQDSPVGIRIVL